MNTYSTSHVISYKSENTTKRFIARLYLIEWLPSSVEEISRNMYARLSYVYLTLYAS